MTDARGTHDGRRRAILALDTATSQVVIAIGSPAGVIEAATTWEARHRHGEHLVASIGRVLGEANVRRSRLVGIVVGTGPGAFTGLRVGMATGKGLAHGLGIPLVGVATGEALLEAARSGGATGPVLLLPAGPSDRVLVRAGDAPRLLPGGTEPDLATGETLVAVDLDGRAPGDALERGEAARRDLGAVLVRLGAARLAAIGDAPGADELATAVPEYVTLPRGARTGSGEMTWSRDPR